MRYYTYISDAKLDQLYGQVPRKALSRFAGELQLDVGVGSVTVSSAQPEVTRFDRLRVVERYIDERCDVGWMTEPRSWFRGELGLRTGFLATGAVYTGLDHDTMVALVGSARHAVDRHTPGTATELSRRSSNLPELLGLVARHAEEYDAERADVDMLFWGRQENVDERVALEQVGYFAQQMRGPREPCDFLARRLLDGWTTGPDGRQVHVVIGTPLYIALSDE